MARRVEKGQDREKGEDCEKCGDKSEKGGKASAAWKARQIHDTTTSDKATARQLLLK